MANTNCLDGIRCPECGQEDGFYIDVVILATVYMTDNGYDDEEGAGTEWGDDSDIRCGDCDHLGQVRDFRTTIKEESNA